MNIPRDASGLRVPPPRAPKAPGPNPNSQRAPQEGAFPERWTCLYKNLTVALTLSHMDSELIFFLILPSLEIIKPANSRLVSPGKPAASCAGLSVAV